MRFGRLVGSITGSLAAYLLVVAACTVDVPPTIPPNEPGEAPEEPLPVALEAFLSADRNILVRGDVEAGHATLTVTTNRESTFLWSLDPVDLLQIDPDTPLRGAPPDTTGQLTISGVTRDPGAKGKTVRVSVVVTEQIGCPQCADGESVTSQLALEVRRPQAPLMVSLVAVEGTSMQPAGTKHLKALISAGKPFVEAPGICNVPAGEIEPGGSTNGNPYCVSWRVIENVSPPPDEPLSARLSALGLRAGDVNKEENDADTVAELVYEAPAANGNATFQLTVVDAAGPTVQREVAVEILSQGAGQVTLRASADHPDLCTGESATITATAEEGTGDNTFTFDFVGDALTGESLRVSGASATYTPPTRDAVTRTIRVTVQEAGGSSDQTNVVITTITSGSCDDGNVCTDDACSFGTCSHTNVSRSCDDRNACTTGDSCSNGRCGGTTVTCNDGNPCTNDFCEPSIGCQYPNNTSSCSDGNACTTGDTCSGGSCVGGPALNCNDGNPCTDDSCKVATGCEHAGNTAACDDALFCNGADTCAGGTCSVHAGNPCAGQCREADDACVDCLGSADCDDAEVCTSDVCDAAGTCVYFTNSLPCDDGLHCNGADTCSGGACSVHGGDPCPGPDVCDEAGDQCVACVNNGDCGGSTPFCEAGSHTCVECLNAGQCDDGVGCTEDTCAGGICVFTENNANCPDDGSYCNGVESCDALNDCVSSGDPCIPGEFCNDATDTCDECLVNGDCDDGVGCTDDTCAGGICVFTENNANCPDDGSYCNGVESCDALNDCVSSGDPCIPGEFCNDATDTCDECLASGDCDDGVGCTDDACAGGICVFTENNANCPDDGAFCNGTEFCDAVLDCQSTGDPCLPALTCDEGTDSCQ